MCGIAGLMLRDGKAPSSTVLNRFAAAMAHRGPDGSGQHISGDTGLVQTRLAIIDLATGDQPFFGPNGQTLVANGEVYNYRALRAALGPDRFHTQSDCEPPLALYADAAEAGFDRLRGMYALALHDAANGRLLLTRDPFGIKPLYYCESADGVAFASEAQALIAAGLASRELAEDKPVELLQLQFTTGAETIYRDIRRVLPGETIIIEGGHIVARRRRAALPEGPPVPIKETEALATLEVTLAQSVRLHLQSDVGYGLFLSGGIDSSVLLALVARETDRPVQTYTVGFPGTAVHDERSAAASMAKRFGTIHREIAFTADDFWSLLPRVAAALDDPAADYATLPTFKMAAMAAEDQKVVLSGEGGDEMFAGYGRYRAAIRPWWRGGKRLRTRGLLDRVGVLRQDDQSWRSGVASAEVLAETREQSRLQMVQRADCADWLPHDLLIKLDRCLMAHGLEGRTPYLDPEVAKFGFRLPDRLKIRREVGKYLLRHLLEKLAPNAGAFERKRGFTVPVAEWIHARAASGPLAQLIAEQPGVAQLCHPDRVQAVFRLTNKSAGQAAWALLFYALWHQINALGLPPAASVEETLAQR